jgi:hypothetical protein
MNEKLIDLFQNKEFVEKTTACETVEEVLNLVNAEGVEAAREEFDAVMDSIAGINSKKDDDLDESELEQVAGGFAISGAVIAALIAAGVTLSGFSLKWWIYDEPYERGKQRALKKNNKRKNDLC